MNLAARRFSILLLILALSIGFGFAFDAAAEAIERKRYPLVEEYAALISDYAEEFGVPEAVIWATVRTESGFASNAVSDDGEVGLMQLTPSDMEAIFQNILREDAPDAGLLYDPKTNLRLGAARLSSLYEQYGAWDTVFAAWHAGTVAVDGWLSDPSNLNEWGSLERIPNKETDAFVSDLRRSVKFYTSLYYEA